MASSSPAPAQDASVVPLLSHALHHIRTTPPRIIASPATQPRRAAVALIIRVVPPPSYVQPHQSADSPANAPAPSLSEFFQLDWVKAPGARPELLFIRRDSPDPNDAAHMSGSGPRTRDPHVAFPGGKTEDGDEGALYTAMRQTWEEIGLDLAESAYTPVGQLDDREITTSLGKRLLMVLSPFVFLQLTPRTTPVDPAPGTALHWMPLSSLLPLDGMRPRWSAVSVDASARLAPRHSWVLRVLMRVLIGTMQFPALIISPATPTLTTDVHASDAKRVHVENGADPALTRQSSIALYRKTPGRAQELKLWGLTLGMTLDLLAYMADTDESSSGEKSKARVTLRASDLLPPDANSAGGMLRVPVVAPSLLSVFPRFSYPDVNFWIWVFGKRYRAVIRGWEASVRTAGVNDRRINWTGSALTTFYAAVRKALVVILVLRAIGVLVALVLGTWVVFW